MRITSNYTNINNNKRNNNQVSFNRRLSINYMGAFNPKQFIDDAEIILAFKKSEAFKKFFELNDGKVVFWRKPFDNNVELEVYHGPVSERPIAENSIVTIIPEKVKSRNPIINFLSAIKDSFKKRVTTVDELPPPPIKQFEKFSICGLSNFPSTNASDTFSSKINKMSYDDIMREIQQVNIEKKLKKSVEIKLKELNNEIDALD